MLRAYVHRVERLIRNWPDSEVTEYSENMMSDERAHIKIRLRTFDGYLLAISEMILAEGDSLIFLDYRYHFQDSNNELIFRYDSAPHYRDLSTHPHHKHLPDTILPSVKPTIEQVLQEALDELRE